jgi:hypothetical protein
MTTVARRTVIMERKIQGKVIKTKGSGSATHFMENKSIKLRRYSRTPT